MGALLRHLGFLTAAALACYCVFLVLSSPNGLPAMREKQRQYDRTKSGVTALQEQVKRKRAEVERMRGSDEARKRAVREHLHKTLPGETTIYLEEPEPAAKP